jgi:hypothetical protein
MVAYYSSIHTKSKIAIIYEASFVPLTKLIPDERI